MAPFNQNMLNVKIEEEIFANAEEEEDGSDISNEENEWSLISYVLSAYLPVFNWMSEWINEWTDQKILSSVFAASQQFEGPELLELVENVLDVRPTGSRCLHVLCIASLKNKGNQKSWKFIMWKWMQIAKIFILHLLTENNELISAKKAVKGKESRMSPSGDCFHCLVASCKLSF